jgi:hypothetical protein
MLIYKLMSYAVTPWLLIRVWPHKAVQILPMKPIAVPEPNSFWLFAIIGFILLVYSFLRMRK